MPTPAPCPLDAPPRSGDPSLPEVITLVLWVVCGAVGVLGWIWQPAPPAVIRPEVVAIRSVTPAVQVQPLPVKPSAAPVEAAAARPRIPLPAPLAAPVSPAPAPPPMVAITPLAPAAASAPSVLTSTAKPAADADAVVSGSGPAGSPGPSPLPGPAAPVPAPPAETLVFGEGEGRQPLPDYPLQALRRGQYGVVSVRLSVDPAGRVTDAEVASPCPWPLLNQAALRVVRERWKFRTGPPRHYEVAIRFELHP